jgi:hypothetical protein
VNTGGEKRAPSIVKCKPHPRYHQLEGKKKGEEGVRKNTYRTPGNKY